MSGRLPKRAFQRLISFLLAPGLCHACGCACENSALCESCAARLERVPGPCQACAQPVAGTGSVCARCRLNPPRWQKMVAPLRYRGLARDYLLQLKYANAPYLSRTLCEQTLPAFDDLQIKPEVLLPVPLHPGRLFARGYNQADEIARTWASLLGVPVDRRALKRRRATLSQSGLSATRRRKNLRGAFTYQPGRSYRHVAVVDDIVTTGATVDEITRLLHRAGVEFVEVWALARAYQR